MPQTMRSNKSGRQKFKETINVLISVLRATLTTWNMEGHGVKKEWTRVKRG